MYYNDICLFKHLVICSVSNIFLIGRYIYNMDGMCTKNDVILL